MFFIVCRTLDSINREILLPVHAVTYISGATGFAGSLLSDHLASQGVNLLISARDEVKLQTLVGVLSRKYPTTKVKSFKCDLSIPNSWESDISIFKNIIVQNYINCSGIQGPIRLNSQISHQEMLSVFNVNLFSSIFFTNLLAKKLQPGEKLSIIHFSGGGSTGPRPLFMPYSLSKTSLIRFVENFAVENSNENIQINAVAPGVMPSKMQEEVMRTPGMEKTKDYLVAENSLLTKDSVRTRFLQLCDFLMSSQSKGITGKLISVDWDNWPEWPKHLPELESSDLFTLRRIAGRDRGQEWGDL